MRQNELHKTFQAAARAFEDGNYPKAAKLIKRVHTAVPNEPSVLHLYGLIAMRSGKAELAIEVLEQVNLMDMRMNRVPTSA